MSTDPTLCPYRPGAPVPVHDGGVTIPGVLQTFSPAEGGGWMLRVRMPWNEVRTVQLRPPEPVDPVRLAEQVVAGVPVRLPVNRQLNLLATALLEARRCQGR